MELIEMNLAHERSLTVFGWAVLAFLLAYACDLRLLLAAGILCVIAYISARTGTWIRPRTRLSSSCGDASDLPPSTRQAG